MKIILLAITVLSLTACGESEKGNTGITEKSPGKSLVENVRLTINPKYQDWVLFKNGTYIVFDRADTIADVRAEAIKQMKEFGPVSAGNPAGDINIIRLNKTEGWIVGGYGYGMYTYVNPSELENKAPDDIEIGLYGRTKRDKDGQNPDVVHINRTH